MLFVSWTHHFNNVTWVLLGTIDYYFKWQWNYKSKFCGRQKLVAIILCTVIEISSFIAKHVLPPSPFSSHYHCSRDFVVTIIEISTLVMIVLVMVFRLHAGGLPIMLNYLCPWINTDMIAITIAFMNHCHCVLWLQVIAVDAVSIIAECYWEVCRVCP